jgi:hypothetical protein
VQHQKLASAHCVPGDRIELQSVCRLAVVLTTVIVGVVNWHQSLVEVAGGGGGVMARSAPELSRPPRQGRSSQRRALGDGQLIVE